MIVAACKMNSRTRSTTSLSALRHQSYPAPSPRHGGYKTAGCGVIGRELAQGHSLEDSVQTSGNIVPGSTLNFNLRSLPLCICKVTMGIRELPNY